MTVAIPPVATPPTEPAELTRLSPRSFVPLAASMLAVFAALLAQQTVIDAAQRWRER